MKRYFNFIVGVIFLQCTSLQADINGHNITWGSYISFAKILSSKDIQYTDLSGKDYKIADIFKNGFAQLPDWECEIFSEEEENTKALGK